MSVTLLCIGDGRDDYHEQAWASAQEQLPAGLVGRVVTVDDRDHTLGFDGAIAKGWREVLDTGADWCFHLEMDFTFNEPVDVGGMIALLEAQPHLAQIALKRQSVNADERRAGGIVEQHPDDFRQRVRDGMVWTEHRRFFTTNPSIYSTNLCRYGWPRVPHSEGIFTHWLREDPDARFAYWGGKFDAPRVTHIGDTRSGTGY